MLGRDKGSIVLVLSGVVLCVDLSSAFSQVCAQAQVCVCEGR